jgi:hypothetical protein
MINNQCHRRKKARCFALTSAPSRHARLQRTKGAEYFSRLAVARSATGTAQCNVLLILGSGMYLLFLLNNHDCTNLQMAQHGRACADHNGKKAQLKKDTIAICLVVPDFSGSDGQCIQPRQSATILCQKYY